MLNALTPLATVLLSSGESWLSDSAGDAPLQAANTLITMQEPSTLSLALIGIACVAIYITATGWRLPRKNTVLTTDRPDVWPVRHIFDDEAEERPTRGAA